MMDKLRFIAAFYMAKTARRVIKALGRKSTHFPGKLAIKICPDFLGRIPKPARIVAVTGTNGKTTVCNAVNDILEKNGYKVLNNREGSNVAAGVATSLLAGCSLTLRAKYDLAVFEVDERSSLKIYPYVKPDYILITNLFRDSMPRNAHAEFIAGIISRGVPPSSKLILNGNDLISSCVAQGNPRVYYGVDRLESLITSYTNLINDIQVCPECGSGLVYDFRVYHHIGRAHCAACGFESPACDYLVTRIDPAALAMTLTDKDGAHALPLLNASVFNIYNSIAATAVLRELGLTYEVISEGIQHTAIIGSRFSEETVADIKIVTQLAKELNPIACSRAFDYVAAYPGDKEILMDIWNMADLKGSENIAWLYDCDFEYLNNDSIKSIVLTGFKAVDQHLRLLIAGVPEEKIKLVPTETEALSLLELTPDKTVFIIHGLDEVDIAAKMKKELKALIQQKRDETSAIA